MSIVREPNNARSAQRLAGGHFPGRPNGRPGKCRPYLMTGAGFYSGPPPVVSVPTWGGGALASTGLRPLFRSPPPQPSAPANTASADKVPSGFKGKLLIARG